MLHNDTKLIQSDFAKMALGEQHTNYFNGSGNTPTDCTRTKVYQLLVRNIFTDTLERAYPLTKNALSTPSAIDDSEAAKSDATASAIDSTESIWQMLVRRFMVEYKHDSPQLWMMPKGLLQFCSKLDIAERFDLPFLYDLLLFEWIEIELSMKEDCPLPLHKTTGDIGSDKLVLNPDYQLLGFKYPVFRYPYHELSDKKGDYLIVCFRSQQDMGIRFMALSELFARSLEIISDTPISGVEAIELALQEMDSEIDKEQAISVGQKFFSQAMKEGLFLGYL